MIVEKIHILIADDHQLFRKGIISLLETVDNIEFIGEVSNGRELIDVYNKLKPDLVIADISMPELSGIEAVKILNERGDFVKAIFLSMYGGEEFIYHCFKVGGYGLINKNISKDELVYAIDKVMNDEKYFGKEYSIKEIEEIVNSYENNSKIIEVNNFKKLTGKEEEILLFIGDGMTSTEIADKLFIAKRTVDTHRSHLMQKLNLKSLPQLIKCAISFSASKRKNAN